MINTAKDAGTAYLTKKEACVRLGISRRTLDRMIAAGRVPHVRMRSFTGGRYRVLFSKLELDNWLLRRLQPDKRRERNGAL